MNKITYTLCISTTVILTSITIANAESPLERGTYLMEAVAACGNCHTPKGPTGDIMEMELAGMSNMLVVDGITAHAPNITPDPETGIGDWSDEEIVRAIREGIRPDGSLIGPPMPIALYRGISDQDVKAIVAYLRQVKPVKNEIPKSDYKIPLPPAYGPPVHSVAHPDPSNQLAYGAYLAGPVAHCLECHSPPSPKGPDFENHPGEGGMQFPGPWGVSTAPAINAKALAHYSDETIKAMTKTGVRPDGTPMMPPMPYSYFSKMNERDLDSILAFLKTVGK